MNLACSIVVQILQKNRVKAVPKVSVSQGLMYILKPSVPLYTNTKENVHITLYFNKKCQINGHCHL